MTWIKTGTPLLGVGFMLTLSACAVPDPFRSSVQGCPVGGQGFSQCMAGSAAASSDEARERRRWMARLQREQIEAEARVQRERAVAGLARR